MEMATAAPATAACAGLTGLQEERDGKGERESEMEGLS